MVSILRYTQIVLSVALMLILEAAISLHAQALDAPSEPTINKHYTPVLLPAAAEQRGICLSGDAQLTEISANHYRMSCGIVLIDTDTPMQIDTHRGSIYTKPHTAVLISKTKEAIRIFDICDRSRNGVQVKFGKHLVNLNSGMEAALVDKDYENPTEVAICPKVGYRQPKVIPFNEKENLVILEFSIVDKLKHCKVFTQLRESPINQDHKLLTEIEKTAAALQIMFKNGLGTGGAAVVNRGWVTTHPKGRPEYVAHPGKKSEQTLATKKDKAI